MLKLVKEWLSFSISGIVSEQIIGNFSAFTWYHLNIWNKYGIIYPKVKNLSFLSNFVFKYLLYLVNHNYLDIYNTCLFT